jgi:hypothetical protein
MAGLREGLDVTVRLGTLGATAVSARVVRVSEEIVVLDSLAVSLAPDPVESGTVVEIAWRHRREQGTVRGRVERCGAHLEVRLERKRESQRRAYVRMPMLLDLQVRTSAGTVVRGVSLDVSAVGIRARIGAPFAIGDRLGLAIRMPDGDRLEVDAHVVRRDGGSVAGLAFEERPEVRERLIRFVLATQQRALARRASASQDTAGAQAHDRIRVVREAPVG